MLTALIFSEAEGAKRAGKVTFNFVDVELSAVAKFVSDITGKNFIFDDRLKGKITIIAPSKLNVEDAYSLFTSVLKLKGFTVVPSGVDAYKIIPSTQARQAGMEITADRPPVNESYIARLIPLKYIASDAALKFIQPVVSRDGHISSFGPGNLLLLVDSGLNVEKVLNILGVIDQPPSLGEEPEVVFLKHSSAETIARMLNEGLGRPKKSAAGQARAVADKRLNAIVLFGNKGMKEAMKRLIVLLDVPAIEEQSAVNVYFLENADAEELAKVLAGLTRGQKPGRKGKPSPFESATLNITPDKATNSLVIVASPSDYQSLVQVIKQLDRRRKQVFVEAMIVEASINKLRDLGVKWRGIVRNKHKEPVVIGGFGSIDITAIQSIISGLAGLTVGGMENIEPLTITTPEGKQLNLKIPSLAALFSLDEFRGVVNVLSTPQLLTSDNTEAEIVVGENVPFISKIEREGTAGATAALMSSIKREDVGIKLRITPQITEGDFVKLDIYQEISSVKGDIIESIFTSVGPTTTKRSTKTSVAVKDDQTVVIGGLMQETHLKRVHKVPLLGDIPLLGWFFKFKTASKEKTNLLVFITPHIVRDAEGLTEITERKQKEFARKEKQYAEGELLVKFKPGVVTAEEAETLIAEKGASVIKAVNGVFHIRLKKGQDVKDAVREFLELPGVQYAEPNYRIKLR